MSVEMLTYAALGDRLKISPEAARSLAKRLRLPRSLSDDGKALVSVDVGEIRHTPCPRGNSGQAGSIAPLVKKIEALQAEIARLEATATVHRADFERERERTDRLMIEVLQASAETMAAREATERLQGEVAALRTSRVGALIDSHGQAARRLGHLAATIIEADRKARR